MSATRLRAPAYTRNVQRRVLLCRAGVGLFFSTSTGHTEDVAGLIKEVSVVVDVLDNGVTTSDTTSHQTFFGFPMFTLLSSPSND